MSEVRVYHCLDFDDRSSQLIQSTWLISLLPAGCLCFTCEIAAETIADPNSQTSDRPYSAPHNLKHQLKIQPISIHQSQALYIPIMTSPPKQRPLHEVVVADTPELVQACHDIRIEGPPLPVTLLRFPANPGLS